MEFTTYLVPLYEIGKGFEIEVSKNYAHVFNICLISPNKVTIEMRRSLSTVDSRVIRGFFLDSYIFGIFFTIIAHGFSG
jgi:hypothetical protein